MIRKFKLFESNLYYYLDDYLCNWSYGNNEDDDVKEIEDIIDIEIEYEYEEISSTEFALNFDRETIEEYLGICEEDQGVINFLLPFDSWYNDYTYIDDDSELEYIGNKLFKKTKGKLKQLVKYLDVNVKINDDDDTTELSELLNSIHGKLIDIYEIIMHISDPYDEQIYSKAKKTIKDLPFNIDHSSKIKNFDVSFKFDTSYILKYLENKPNIKTVNEYLLSYDYSNLNYDYLTNTFEYDLDFSAVNIYINDSVDKILKMSYDEIYEKLDFKNIENVIRVGGKLLEWFKSYKFQKEFMKREDLKKYKELEEYELTHPKIKDEYGHLLDAEKFNL